MSLETPEDVSLFSKQLGSAGPLISFESGIAASHLNWMGIAPRVAQFGRVFLYDRAGYVARSERYLSENIWHRDAVKIVRSTDTPQQ